MIAEQEPRWFAIQARPGSEAAADAQLRMLPVETFLPLRRRSVRHATRANRLVLRPLFPGYLFARFCAATELRAVRYSRGVLRVLGRPEAPWPVEDAIVTSLQARLGREGWIELAERPFCVGDYVHITSGPLAGWNGVFDRELNDAQRVMILIETVQQGRVVIRRDWLELSDAA